jgi:hypothetical protein
MTLSGGDTPSYHRKDLQSIFRGWLHVCLTAAACFLFSSIVEQVYSSPKTKLYIMWYNVTSTCTMYLKRQNNQ